MAAAIARNPVAGVALMVLAVTLLAPACDDDLGPLRTGPEGIYDAAASLGEAQELEFTPGPDLDRRERFQVIVRRVRLAQPGFVVEITIDNTSDAVVLRPEVDIFDPERHRAGLQVRGSFAGPRNIRDLRDIPPRTRVDVAAYFEPRAGESPPADLAGWTVDVEAQGIAATSEPSIARWKADR